MVTAENNNKCCKAAAFSGLLSIIIVMFLPIDLGGRPTHAEKLWLRSLAKAHTKQLISSDDKDFMTIS